MNLTNIDFVDLAKELSSRIKSFNSYDFVDSARFYHGSSCFQATTVNAKLKDDVLKVIKNLCGDCDAAAILGMLFELDLIDFDIRG